MSTNEHMSADNLERYSFLWSEARLVIAAVALFLGGIPPLYYFIRIPSFWSFERSLLTIAWILSGIASAYLLYRWNSHKTVFGGKNQMDLGTFLVMIVSGLNLGLAGLIGQNIGMTIASSRAIFVIVGLLYLATAYHLYTRWQAHHQKVF